MPAHRQPTDGFLAAVTSANRIPDPGAAGTINVDRSPAYLGATTAAAEARTLAVPDAPGLDLTIALETDGGDLTLTVTDGFDQDGNTSVVFDDAGDYIRFVSVEVSTSAFEWRVVGFNGVTGTGTSTSSEDITLSADNKIAGQGSTIGWLSPAAAQQALSGAGAVNITTFYTAWTTTGADAGTLADGAQIGQVKKIQLIVDGGDGTLTPSNLSGGTTITFADAGDFAVLMWDGTNWVALELGNGADGATAPVLA